jgi:hypothetical protein
MPNLKQHIWELILLQLSAPSRSFYRCEWFNTKQGINEVPVSQICRAISQICRAIPTEKPRPAGLYSNTLLTQDPLSKALLY